MRSSESRKRQVRELGEEMRVQEITRELRIAQKEREKEAEMQRKEEFRKRKWEKRWRVVVGRVGFISTEELDTWRTILEDTTTDKYVFPNLE